MVDLIRFPYKATMRAFDGSTFDVQWVILDDDTTDLDVETPFRSSRNDEYSPFDMGFVGEIPEFYPARSDILTVPKSVCRDCRIGIDDWWTNGWPSDAPPVVLGPNGFAEGCVNPVPPVISVGLALPTAEWDISNSPVTSIGTLTGDWKDQAQFTVFAAPFAGDGRPAFRLLTVDYLPLIPVSILTGPGTIDPALLPGGGGGNGNVLRVTLTSPGLGVFYDTGSWPNGVLIYGIIANPNTPGGPNVQVSVQGVALNGSSDTLGTFTIVPGTAIAIVFQYIATFTAQGPLGQVIFTDDAGTGPFIDISVWFG